MEKTVVVLKKKCNKLPSGVYVLLGYYAVIVIFFEKNLSLFFYFFLLRITRTRYVKCHRYDAVKIIIITLDTILSQVSKSFIFIRLHCSELET